MNIRLNSHSLQVSFFKLSCLRLQLNLHHRRKKKKRKSENRKSKLNFMTIKWKNAMTTVSKSSSFCWRCQRQDKRWKVKFVAFISQYKVLLCPFNRRSPTTFIHDTCRRSKGSKYLIQSDHWYICIDWIRLNLLIQFRCVINDEKTYRAFISYRTQWHLIAFWLQFHSNQYRFRLVNMFTWMLLSFWLALIGNLSLRNHVVLASIVQQSTRESWNEIRGVSGRVWINNHRTPLSSL